MEYKQYTLEQLQNMFEKEQNLEELNKIMSAISDKYYILSDDNEASNNISIEKEIYRQMNLINYKILICYLQKKLKENQIKNVK